MGAQEGRGAHMVDRICVGAIAGAFGSHGEVRLKSFCAEPADIATYGPLSTEDNIHQFKITLTRPIKLGFAAQLSGITTKDAADALRGVRLHAPRRALPYLPDDEFYHADLIGLTAVDTGGRVLGQVAAVLNHGAGDLLEVRGKTGQNVLIPFTKINVPTVDLALGRLIIDPPAGILG